MHSARGSSLSRFFRTLGALCLGAVAMGQASCVDNQLSLVISRFVPVDRASDCKVTPATTDLVTNGLLDVGITAFGYSGYIAAPVVENRLIVRGTTSNVETNTIQLTGFEVELRPGAGLEPLIADVSRKFFVPAAGGFLEPGGGAVALLVEVVPRALAVQLSTQLQPGALPERLIARIRPVGLHAGRDIEGGSIDLPIDLCKNCLNQPQPAQGCPSGGLPEASIQLGSCNPAQDASVTCCTAATTVCGADVPVMIPGM